MASILGRTGVALLEPKQEFPTSHHLVAACCLEESRKTSWPCDAAFLYPSLTVPAQSSRISRFSTVTVTVGLGALAHVHAFCRMRALSTQDSVSVSTASRKRFLDTCNTLSHLFLWLSVIITVRSEGWNCLFFLCFQPATLNI